MKIVLVDPSVDGDSIRVFEQRGIGIRCLERENVRLDVRATAMRTIYFSKKYAAPIMINERGRGSAIIDCVAQILEPSA